MELAFQALAPLAVGFSREEVLEKAEFDPSREMLSVEFDWLKTGNRRMKTWENTILGHIEISKGRLVADVNSAERAQRLRHEIEERLSLAGTHESTVSKTLEAMMESPPPPKTAEDSARQAKFDELMRDPDGKEAVEALLLQFERHDQRQTSPNDIRPDISALRRLLQLGPRAS